MRWWGCRVSLDVCPPANEMIAARGTRDYAFEWVVPMGARGAGTFVADLDAGLPEVKVRAMRVE